jgi:hypothetical protein
MKKSIWFVLGIFLTQGASAQSSNLLYTDLPIVSDAPSYVEAMNETLDNTRIACPPENQIADADDIRQNVEFSTLVQVGQEGDQYKFAFTSFHSSGTVRTTILIQENSDAKTTRSITVDVSHYQKINFGDDAHPDIREGFKSSGQVVCATSNQ